MAYDTDEALHIKEIPFDVHHSESSLKLTLCNIKKAIEADAGKVTLLKILRNKPSFRTHHNKKSRKPIKQGSDFTVRSCILMKRIPLNVSLHTSDPSLFKSISIMQEDHMISYGNASKQNENTQSSSSVTVNNSSATPSYWRLVRKGYTKKNQSFLLRHDLSSFYYVGRGPDCDFQCKAGNISRIHFKLLCEKSNTSQNQEVVQWSIQDLGSLAGTYLNGKKLCQDKDYLLLKDDVITLANDTFSLETIPGDKYSFVYQVTNNEFLSERST